MVLFAHIILHGNKKYEPWDKNQYALRIVNVYPEESTKTVWNLILILIQKGRKCMILLPICGEMINYYPN